MISVIVKKWGCLENQESNRDRHIHATSYSAARGRCSTHRSNKGRKRIKGTQSCVKQHQDIGMGQGREGGGGGRGGGSVAVNAYHSYLHVTTLERLSFRRMQRGRDRKKA